MGADELLAGQLVQSLCQPLREAAAVREDDRAVVAADQVEEPGMDRRPDARAHVAVGHGTAGLLVGRQDLAEAGHVLDRDFDGQLERLATSRVDDAHRPRPVLAESAEEPRDFLQRTLRRREPDALERRVSQPLQAFNR